MSRLTLITGGAGSGKSRYACERAGACGENILFVATCVPRDDEMRSKVARHRAERPSGWRTVETVRDVASAFAPGYDAAVLDCLTLLVADMLVSDLPESDILGEVARISLGASYPVFLVTNEVGSGIVPENALSRRFREIAGRANQIAARHAEEVILMVSGVAVPIKGASCGH